MLEGKRSVDSCWAVGATAAPELTSTFAAIKRPLISPKPSRPQERWWDRAPAPAWRIATAWVLTLPSTILLSDGLFYLLS